MLPSLGAKEAAARKQRIRRRRQEMLVAAADAETAKQAKVLQVNLWNQSIQSVWKQKAPLIATSLCSKKNSETVYQLG